MVIFSKALCSRFDRESHFLGSFTKLRQMGTIKEFIMAFGLLDIRTKNLSEEFYK